MFATLDLRPLWQSRLPSVRLPFPGTRLPFPVSRYPTKDSVRTTEDGIRTTEPTSGCLQSSSPITVADQWRSFTALPLEHLGYLLI